MHSSTRMFGSAMIITGTTIGAGMLAIPATVSGVGFWLACLLLILVWAILLSTALLLVEINLTMPDGTNFAKMAKHTLGFVGQALTWVAYLLLLYSLTAAYSAAGGDLIASVFKLLETTTPD